MEAQSPHQPQRVLKQTVGAIAPRGPETWRRAPTPQELFRHELFQSERVRGQRWNPASREFRAFAENAWVSLGAEEQAQFSARAELLRSVAQSNRRRKRDAQESHAIVCQPCDQLVENSARTTSMSLHSLFHDDNIDFKGRPIALPTERLDHA
eukprot:5745516-Lingulodinium_polyedra.AAC.1